MRGQPRGSLDDPVREQLLQNCEALQRLVPQLVLIYEGLCALMHDGETVAFSAALQEASMSGQQVYLDQYFSAHAVTADAEKG
jgi:hypothetical protein